MFVRCKMPVRCALLEEEQDVGQNGNDKNLNCIFSIEGKNSHMIYLNSVLSGQLLQFLENFALWVYDKGHSNASRILRLKSAIELKYFLVQLCSDALDIVTQCL